MSQSASTITHNRANREAISLLARIFPTPRNYSVILGDETVLPATEGETFCLIIRSTGVLKRMFTPPLELSLGEAYIHGELDIQGDLVSAFDLVDEIGKRISSPGVILHSIWDMAWIPGEDPIEPDGRGPIQLNGALHSKERDRTAVRYHYDVGNDFYAIWLDKNMQYSCGYFPIGTEALDAAQEKKMEHICRKLRLKPGERLLDIGCGWGGLIRYAVQHYDVTALGVTLSEKQADYANQQARELGLSDQAKVEVQDYRDLQSGSFDKIVSVGMFEHVGRAHLPGYFSHAYRLLKPGGLFLNHGIALRITSPQILEVAGSDKPVIHSSTKTLFEKWTEKKILGIGTFSQRYIFPDGELELVSDVNLFGEKAGFEVRDVENLREHYALTIRKWVQNIEDRRIDVIRTTNEVVYRTWRLYLSSSIHGFERGQISVNQTLFAKPDQGKSKVPLTRADLYR